MSTTYRPTEPIELSKLKPASNCSETAGPSPNFEPVARLDATAPDAPAASYHSAPRSGLPVDKAPPRPTPLAVNADTISPALVALPQWVVWRYTLNEGRWTKPPFNARTGGRAQSNNPATHATFLTALNTCRDGSRDLDGLGFCFHDADGLAGLDLDHVLDQSTGELSAPAAAIVERFKGTYCEYSPGGDGIRIFCYGKVRRTGKIKARVKWLEAYDHTSPRYLTVTGHRVPGTAADITDQQDALDWLHQTYMSETERPPKEKPQHPAAPDLALTDTELLDKALAASNGGKFRALWNGDTSAYGGDDSAADMALCGLLAFWTQKETGRMDRLFRQSGLMRPKWERADYRQRTIDKAIAECQEVYSERRRQRGNGHDTEAPDFERSPIEAYDGEADQNQDQGADWQEPEPAPEESPVARKVREIVESSTDLIAIDQALRVLAAEEKVSLRVLQVQAKEVRRQKTERKARRKERSRNRHDAGPTNQEYQREGRAERLKKLPYSLVVQSERGASYLMQPSQAANILARVAHHELAYDLSGRRWLRYVGTHWQEINDDRVSMRADQLIEAGAGDIGYGPGFVNAVVTMLRARLAVEQFDNDPRLVPCLNGILNLRTRHLHPHGPGFRLTWCLPYAYDANATCEPIKAFFRQCVKGDPLQVEVLRAILKAMITGRADLQRYAEIIGPGGTGKGSYMRLAEALVGSRNTHATTLKRLETNRFETSQLVDKRLCLITDSERYANEVSIFKAMIGQDTLPNEKKHQQHGEPFRFRGFAILAGNENIGSADLTSGMQRRRITIRFDYVVPEHQRRNLEAEFEPLLPGVLTWCLAMDDERMRQLLVETARYAPTLGRIALDTLVENNSIAAWLAECIILDSKAITPVGRLEKATLTDMDSEIYPARRSVTIHENADKWLYSSYVRHCARSNTSPVGNRRFSGLLADLITHQLKITEVRYEKKAHGSDFAKFCGIRLRADGETTPGILDGLSDRYHSESPPAGDNTGHNGQQTDSKRTANIEETDITDITFHFSSKSSPEPQHVSKSDLADIPCAPENNVPHVQKNIENPQFAVRRVRPSAQSNTYDDFCCPFPVRDMSAEPEVAVRAESDNTAPPDPGPGYLDALVESFQSGAAPEPRPATPADDDLVDFDEALGVQP